MEILMTYFTECIIHYELFIYLFDIATLSLTSKVFFFIGYLIYIFTEGFPLFIEITKMSCIFSGPSKVHMILLD